jgi:hypothetical protein
MDNLSSDNPFEERRLNTVTDYQLEWDVPSLNQAISDPLTQEIRKLKEEKGVSAKQTIAVLLGPAGYGKTHLFGRIAHQLGPNVLFMFVPQFPQSELSRPLEYIRWYAIESLFEPATAGSPAPIKQILAGLCARSFRVYFETHLSDPLKTKHQTLRQRLQEDASAVLEILAPVTELLPYQKLADSVAAAVPLQHLRTDIVRALALGWSPAAGDVRRWLRGEDLQPEQCGFLGLGEEPPPADKVILAIATLLQQVGITVVCCCDQLDAVLKDVQHGPMHLTNDLVGLLQGVPNLKIILSCFTDKWHDFLQHAHQAFRDRVNEYKLSSLTEQQALELAGRRLSQLPGRRPDRGPTWPIQKESFSNLVKQSPQNPRGLIKACREAIDRWFLNGSNDWVSLQPDGNGPIDLPALFLQQWNKELQAVQQAARSPNDVPEPELFDSVHEALRLVPNAQLLPAGMQLDQIQTRAIRPSPKDARPSVSLRLGVGKQAFSVVVAVTRKDSGTAFSNYFAALEEAMGGEVIGAVLIRPRGVLAVGPKAEARVRYEKAVSQGKLRPFPLDEEQVTFEHLACLLRVLRLADSQMLQLAGKTCTEADCRKLIIETKLLNNLKLFDIIFNGWQPVEAARATAMSGKAAPVATATAESTILGNAVVAQDTPLSDTSSVAVDQGPAPPPALTGPQAWAKDLLNRVVEKLRNWRLPVKPLNFEIGPSFVRLKVQPEDQTDINKVRNKADYLKLHLSLAARPLIGFQAGYISIDVQRPERQTVQLSEMLGTRPADLQGQAAFPVGVDVSGQPHWLNLGDTANCHLLIAGTTGSGKSEFMKVIIAALASGLPPDQLQFILIDPKRVTFNFSGDSPYFRAPVARDNAEALPLIESCFLEMETRYKLLEKLHRQNISELKGADARPRIVLLFDEFADLILDKASKKQMEPLLKRLGAKARAAGIHLILGTQRTEAAVVTPLLRSNLPGRISLQVITDRDSKLILDTPGAANLLGKGDLLWRQGGDLLRLQSGLVKQEELENLLRIH